MKVRLKIEVDMELDMWRLTRKSNRDDMGAMLVEALKQIGCALENGDDYEVEKIFFDSNVCGHDETPYGVQTASVKKCGQWRED